MPRELTVSRSATPESHPEFTIYDDSDDGRRVAIVFSKADADLFAAAPALLEAMERLIDHACERNGDYDAISNAYAALTLARGESANA